MRMALSFLGISGIQPSMNDDKFVSTVLDAINRDDAKKLLEEALEKLGQAGPDLIMLAQQVFAAGFALGGAGNQDFPPQAQNVLTLLAGKPVAGEAFRTMREELGISQTDIGKLCGVTHAAVSEWERGETPMPGSAIRAMVTLITKKTPSLEEVISGADLRALRKKLGMQQKELALELGVSVSAIEKWEGNASKPLAEATVQRIRPELDKLRARAAAAA